MRYRQRDEWDYAGVLVSRLAVVSCRGCLCELAARGSGAVVRTVGSLRLRWAYRRGLERRVPPVVSVRLTMAGVPRRGG